MLEILRLIRFRTIAFFIFTMYSMRYFVLFPLLQKEGFTLQMSNNSFSLLVIAICALISGAYVINDYFDTRRDRLSGYKTIIVGNTVSRRSAIILHTLCNIVAITISIILSIRYNVWEIFLFFFIISVLLWLYSSHYKKTFILGNLTVALFASLVPISVAMFEIPLLNDRYSHFILDMGIDFNYLLPWTLGFSYSLFFNTFIYEINKDIFSVKGDKDENVKTFPVKLGIPQTKWFITILVSVCIISLLVLYVSIFYPSISVLSYFLIALIIPYTVYLMWVRGEGKMNQQLYLIRIIMVLCISFSLLIKCFLNH